MPPLPLPTPHGVISASNLLRDYILRTPLLTSPILNKSPLLQELNISRLYIKAESLQHTNSFKYRGALHRLLTLTNDQKSKGVIAFSSGNFGQALSAASQTLAVSCTIVAPHDAPPLKTDRIANGYGAELILSTASSDGENREVAASSLAKRIARDRGTTLLHPFEDVDVVHGQGTVGWELLEQVMTEYNDKIDTIVVPCGGGGLTAGINLAVEARGMRDDVGVIAVEPLGYDDHVMSFRSDGKQRLSLDDIYSNGTSSSITRETSNICDALMAGAPGDMTWSVNASRLSDVVPSRGDESVVRAMKVAFDYFRLVLEPSGALALAAVLDGDVQGDVVGVVASGGNVDLNSFAKILGCLGGT